MFYNKCINIIYIKEGISGVAEFGNYYTIDLCGKIYKISKEKALYIFSKLENKVINNMSSVEFENYLKKYDMYDEVVLENLVNV